MFTKMICLVELTMKSLKDFITVFGCISIEYAVLFRNLAELPNDIILPYVL
jgi:hypothetical protein